MEVNASPAVIVQPIVRWVLMSGGMLKEVKILYVLPAWDVVSVRKCAPGGY